MSAGWVPFGGSEGPFHTSANFRLLPAIHVGFTLQPHLCLSTGLFATARVFIAACGLSPVAVSRGSSSWWSGVENLAVLHNSRAAPTCRNERESLCTATNTQGSQKTMETNLNFKKVIKRLTTSNVARMWKNWNLRTLLVVTSTSKASLENSLTVSYTLNIQPRKGGEGGAVII